MADTPPTRSPGTGIRVVLVLAALMWALEVVDLASGHMLDDLGIRPRTVGGLVGVGLAPLLHFGFGHLLANTVPFVVLGLTIAVTGAARVAAVTVLAAATSGLAVWLLAPTASVTAGASGIVFGYAAYLLVRGVRSRRLGHLAIAVAVVMVFGSGLLVGLLPTAGISWLGHLFGAAGGALAAWLVTDRRAPTTPSVRA